MKQCEDLVPYEAVKSLPNDICYLDSQTLETHNTCVFKGSFYDKNGKKARFVMVPDTFFSLHTRRDCTLVFSLVGLRDFYRLPAWGMDIKRKHREDINVNLFLNKQCSSTKRQRQKKGKSSMKNCFLINND